MRPSTSLISQYLRLLLLERGHGSLATEGLLLRKNLKFLEIWKIQFTQKWQRIEEFKDCRRLFFCYICFTRRIPRGNHGLCDYTDTDIDRCLSDVTPDISRRVITGPSYRQGWGEGGEGGVMVQTGLSWLGSNRQGCHWVSCLWLAVVKRFFSNTSLVQSTKEKVQVVFWMKLSLSGWSVQPLFKQLIPFLYCGHWRIQDLPEGR